MRFRTELEMRPAGELLDPGQPIVLMGSCFSDNIGNRMRECRWRAFPNITGALYNPSSVANILRTACVGDSISDIIKESTVKRDRQWMSWLTDSGGTTFTEQDTEDRVFGKMIELRKRLSEARTLIVTFGTAWVYELRERPGYIVSNCHKFPADTFLRRRLSISEIASEWHELSGVLGKTFPNIRIIFTVSPVRHLKDGFEGNSRSKAVLQLACEEICADNDKAEYFPAFEIVNDDLRDYRFYASDLVHPFQEAVGYIWEKFQDRYLSKASRSILEEGERVTRRLNHRPIMHEGSQLAEYLVSQERRKAFDVYNAFINDHPGMLRIDE